VVAGGTRPLAGLPGTAAAAAAAPSLLRMVLDPPAVSLSGEAALRRARQGPALPREPVYLAYSLRCLTSEEAEPSRGGGDGDNDNATATAAFFRTQRIRQTVHVLQNPVLSPRGRAVFAHYYAAFRRLRALFAHLVRRWRLRRCPVQIQTDLFLAPLLPTDPRLYVLVHGRGQYYFSLSDLARTIVSAITHHEGFFLAPLPVRNPYTNVVLTKTDLYNIYLTMKERAFPVPAYLQLFFRCEFDVYAFRRRAEAVLRSSVIRRFVREAPYTELYPDLLDMLHRYRMQHAIRPDAGYSLQRWVDHMRPLLGWYFLRQYSLDVNERQYAECRVRTGLDRFAEDNPRYGKRIPCAFRHAGLPAVYVDTVQRSAAAAGVQPEEYWQNHVYREAHYNRSMRYAAAAAAAAAAANPFVPNVFDNADSPHGEEDTEQEEEQHLDADNDADNDDDEHENDSVS
jgi:hypothetical protein